MLLESRGSYRLGTIFQANGFEPLGEARQKLGGRNSQHLYIRRFPVEIQLSISQRTFEISCRPT